MCRDKTLEVHKLTATRSSKKKIQTPSQKTLMLPDVEEIQYPEKVEETDDQIISKAINSYAKRTKT
jgi:hypothetical protein